MSELDENRDPAAPGTDWTPADAPLEMPRQVLEAQPRTVLLGLGRLMRMRLLRP